MGVYVQTFRTEHRVATLNGAPVKVYAYRYLCHLRDLDDHWGERKRRAALMGSHVVRSGNLFAEHKPAYVAHVYENGWEGALVYEKPTGAIWYDCDAFPGRVVGFLKRVGRSFTIVQERETHSQQNVAGWEAYRHLTERVENGEVKEETRYWVIDGKRVTPEAFEAWRGPATEAYVAAWRKQEDERVARERLATDARAAKLAAADAEIQAAQARVEALRQARATL